MTRFGSLSVKVKKTTEAVKAFNSYFNSKMGSDSADSASSSQPSSLGPISLPMDFVHTSGQSAIRKTLETLMGLLVKTCKNPVFCSKMCGQGPIYQI